MMENYYGLESGPYTSEEAFVYESFPAANNVRRLFSRRGFGKWKTPLNFRENAIFLNS